MARRQTEKINPDHRRIRVKRDDQVQVISGKDKGKSGRVLDVDRERARVLVEGVNMVKKHLRPNQQRGIKGGIAEREAFLHISNVMPVTSEGQTTRLRVKLEDAGGKIRRTRIAVRNGEEIGKG